MGKCIHRQRLRCTFSCIVTFIVLYSPDARYAEPLLNNDRPIIAVLAQMSKLDDSTSYIASSYVKYLESAGARVVPIPHYLPESQTREIFSYVNGVFFPGGGIKWFKSPYYKNAKLFLDLALAANERGDYFPVWGTCLGFEALHVILADSIDILTETDAEDVSYPLDFTSQASNSRMFREMSDKLFTSLKSKEITYNHHKKGIDPEIYKTNNVSFDRFFKILSTNKDENGKEFVSTVEAYDYPIYGTQWHPERNNFEFTTLDEKLPHSSLAIKLSQYMANFFVDEARKSFHRFPSEELEKDSLIYNFNPEYSAKKFSGFLGHLEQIYLFSPSDYD